MIDKDEMILGQIMLHYLAQINGYCRICGELRRKLYRKCSGKRLFRLSSTSGVV